MVAAVDPEVVLLGGGLGGAALQALTRAPALSPWYQCPVVAAQLGDDAGVIGGRAALVEHLIEPEPTAIRRGLPPGDEMRRCWSTGCRRAARAASRVGFPRGSAAHS